ncbi:MAG: aminotransferase class I/II-fold pyridoxal phosphate-dependent enzyme [Candidatus Omnitrophica bacterium]|nr:aminotransferase class I/II-fold pyridoxal phosphate-dependent enzyme [Candidatus Omnitrophota bacterium]
MKISSKVLNMAPSGIRAFFDLVIGMKDVISLGVGEPDFVTPWHIRESGIYAVEKGYTSYTSNKGLMELRKAISKFLKNKHGLDYDPEDEILITVGVSEGYDLAIRAMVERGDKVIVPEPYYVAYGPIVDLSGGKAVYLRTKAEDGFKLRPEDLLATCDKGTIAMVLNYPNNPTGAAYTRKELLAIADIAKKKDITVISDEVYEDLTYDGKHTAFPTLPGMRERTIYLNGFSKAYAMTGWRIAYAAGPKEIIAAMTKVHQYTMLCASIISQMAAMEAMRNGGRAVAEMTREYRRRREYLISRLNEMGLSCHKPEGAFYAFPSIKSSGLSSMDFAHRLLKEEKVAVVPGTAFGASGEGYVRMCYAASFDNIREAMSRIERFLCRM